MPDDMRKHIDAVTKRNPQSVVVTAPHRDPTNDNITIFLAGSIDMGKAVDWQAEIIGKVSNLPIPVTFFNPRRDDWDSSWEQDISNPEFAEQVNWELDHLEKADIVCVYSDPEGEAPITLMELGLHAASGKVVLCCPEGYWRRGNVQIVCQRNNIKVHNDIDELVAALTERIQDFG